MHTWYIASVIGMLTIMVTGQSANAQTNAQTNAQADAQINAQALFTQPDTSPNYAAYRNVDECVAAINRLTLEVNLKDTLWSDTAEFDLVREARPLPLIAREMGRRCLAKLSVDTLPLKDVDLWVPPLLMVDRDADAERWYTKLLDSLPIQERQPYFIEIMKAISTARPIRIELVKRVYAWALRDMPFDSLFPGIMFHFAALDPAMQTGDTAFQHMVLDRFVSLIDRIPPDMKTDQGYRAFIAPMLYRVLQLATVHEGIDSLTQSSDAFVAYRKALWARVSDSPFEASEEPIGAHTPALDGNFWFSADPSNFRGGTSASPTYTKTDATVRPVLGKINIIAFLQGGCHSSTPVVLHGRSNGLSRCWPTIAILRRLKHTYPDAELTIVTKTYGSIGDAPPLEPASEADTLAKYFLEFHRLPATLVVTTGQFFRLPGLDQRRIDRSSQNETNYQFSREGFNLSGTVFLSDRDGKIFFSGALQRERESQLKDMMQAVYRRGE